MEIREIELRKSGGLGRSIPNIWDRRQMRRRKKTFC